VAAWFTPRSVWHVVNGGPIEGVYRGIDEIFDYFRWVDTETGGTLRHQITDVLANNQRAVVFIRLTGRRGLRAFDGVCLTAYEFEGDQVAEAWAFAEDGPAYAEFWSSPD